jgi:hypothetical protein
MPARNRKDNECLGFQQCLTERIVRLEFAPVPVVNQRDWRAKYFPQSWDCLSFAINYLLRIRRRWLPHLLRRPIFLGSSAIERGNAYGGWMGEDGSARGFLPC